MTTRRQILAALGAGALAPLAAFAQQPVRIWRVGFLAQRHVGPPDKDVYRALVTELRALGYVEGRNLAIEWRSAEGVTERLPALAAELVRLKVDVIVAAGSPAIAAAQKATTTIPIVMGSVGDPVGSGFVKSLAKPGGNITGRSIMTIDFVAKQLDLLRDTVPGLSRLAFLHNPVNSSEATIFANLQENALRAGMDVVMVRARTAAEIEAAFAAARRAKAGAIIVGGDQTFTQEARQIASLAARNHLASLALYAVYAEAGGLMSYGPNQTDSYRGAAVYVDKILKGAKPEDLPVEQPTMFELVVNMKTAKMLGVKIPQSILLRADRVIE